jgi:archaellum biogenesis ATPase FlaH
MGEEIFENDVFEIEKFIFSKKHQSLEFNIQLLAKERGDDIQHFASSVLSDMKLVFCKGAEKSGKTGLTYKLLHSLYTDQQLCNRFTPLYICLHDSTIYTNWSNQYKVSETEANSIDNLHKINLCAMFSMGISIDNCIVSVKDLIASTEANFIIVDGFDHFAHQVGYDDAYELMSYLDQLIKVKNMHIFFTYTSDEWELITSLKVGKTFVEWMMSRSEEDKANVGSVKLSSAATFYTL